MRLRTLDPSLLDTKWLVACWREWLLAKKCLEAYSKWEKVWYVNHPQLDRFKKCQSPICAINEYLYYIYQEWIIRWFKFDSSKIQKVIRWIKIPTWSTQLDYEYNLLSAKVRNRNKNFTIWDKKPSPMFSIHNNNTTEQREREKFIS